MVGLCLKYENANYGSKLQALATIRLTETLGYECRVIHYGKKGLWFKIKAFQKIFCSSWRQDKLEELSRSRIIKKHPKWASSLKQRHEVFKKYDEKYFDKYEVYGASYKNIQEIAKSFDAVVTCSDQLWSPSGYGTDFYNLMFVPDHVRKVSLASSFGVDNIPNYQKKGTARYINRIEYVSCRENRGAEIVNELTCREVPILMDPVFAFDKEQWKEMIPEEKVYDEPYIFCYFLGANSKYRDLVREFAKQKKMKVVFLKFLDQYVECDENFGDITPFDVDPNKFLNIIRGAEYVITDSFHGCAFSIINQKRFVVLNRYSSISGASKNSRIDTVCENLGLEKRRVNADSDITSFIDKPIAWTEVHEKLDVYRNRMWSYLKEALNTK
ncbi:MAG: polysaccharide pyruvyl transferase family protein [Prevotella sp.]|nr:polysaccharide pyruvyl transferase family protein [Prevotella sp.]